MEGTKSDWYSAFLAMSPPYAPPPTPAQIEALKADPFNGGKPMTGGEYLMTTRAVLVMASNLDKKGLANVRAAYPDLDICLTHVNHMVQGTNPRASVTL